MTLVLKVKCSSIKSVHNLTVTTLHTLCSPQRQVFKVMSRIEDYFPKVSKCTDTIHRECSIKLSPPTSAKLSIPAKLSISAKKRPIARKGQRPVGRPRKNKQPEVIDLTSEASPPPAKKTRKGDKTDSSESEESHKSSRSILHPMYSPAQKRLWLHMHDSMGYVKVQGNMEYITAMFKDG